MNFLQFAVWGSYLTSMGGYLFSEGYGDSIGWFYAMQGVVSIFMPAIMGIIADKWIPAQRLLGICHGLAAIFIAGAGYFAQSDLITPMFILYSLSVAFYMPTLALSNSVAYTSLEQGGYDTVKAFPPIRVFGTVGFIVAMLICDFAGFQANYMQFYQCALIGICLALYTMALPHCPVSKAQGDKSLMQRLGLDAFKLFKSKQMALFFIFSMLLGVSLQITNGFANGFITSFKNLPEFANTFGANHANALISLSQVSETLCILLIPFFLKRFGIKRVMLIAMSITLLIPKRLRKKGMSKMHNVSETCDNEISALAWLAPKVLANSGRFLNEVIKPLAKPLVICNDTPSNIEKMKKSAICLLLKSLKASRPRRCIRLLSPWALLTGQWGSAMV